MSRGDPSVGYGVLSRVYDRWQRSYGQEYGRAIVPRVVASLEAWAPHGPRTLIDLGCGTGTLSLLLAERGWQVTGVDASPGMIEEARGKRKAKGRANVHFEVQDLRRLHLPSPVAVAVSVYDVLNHLLTPHDLAVTLTAVHAALLPGGLFLFDVNNEACYHALWTQREVVRHHDFTMVLENTYDAVSGRARSEVVVRFAGGGEDQRETVEQQCHRDEEIASLLRQAGFPEVQSERFAFPGVPGAGKLKTWWVARRDGSTTAGPPPAR